MHLGGNRPRKGNVALPGTGGHRHLVEFRPPGVSDTIRRPSRMSGNTVRYSSRQGREAASASMLFGLGSTAYMWACRKMAERLQQGYGHRHLLHGRRRHNPKAGTHAAPGRIEHRCVYHIEDIRVGSPGTTLLVLGTVSP